MAQLTYEQLFDILRREKSRDELQQLDQDFYRMASDFLAEKSDALTAASSRGLNSLAAQRAQIEYQNVKKILRELYARREKKIITLAMHRTRTEAAVIETNALLADEKRFFETLVDLMRTTRADLLAFLGEEEPAHEEPAPRVKEHPPAHVATEPGDTISVMEDQEGQVEVRFLAVVPKFVGKNLKVYGPFQEGETTRLPMDIAHILIRKGRAEEMAE